MESIREGVTTCLQLIENVVQDVAARRLASMTLLLLSTYRTESSEFHVVSSSLLQHMAEPYIGLLTNLPFQHPNGIGFTSANVVLHPANNALIIRALLGYYAHISSKLLAGDVDAIQDGLQLLPIMNDLLVQVLDGIEAG